MKSYDKSPNHVDAHVGAKLTLRRNMMGLSKERLGGILEWPVEELEDFEAGVRRISASRLYALSLTLKVPVAYFFDGYSS